MENFLDFLEFDRQTHSQQAKILETPTKATQYEVENAQLFHRFETEAHLQAIEFESCASNIRELFSPPQAKPASAKQKIPGYQDNRSNEGFEVLRKGESSTITESTPNLHSECFEPAKVHAACSHTVESEHSKSQTKLQHFNGVVQLTPDCIQTKFYYRIPDRERVNSAFRQFDGEASNYRKAGRCSESDK